MKQKFPAVFISLCCILALMENPEAQPKIFTVKANEIKAAVQPTMWGIFFEDINMGADGGVYAELVKNRSFEFAAPMMGWREQKKDASTASALIINRSEINPANPRFIRIKVPSGNGLYGLSNEGFRGMGVKNGNQYKFSVLASQAAGSNIALNAELVNAKGETIGSGTIKASGQAWKKYEVAFTCSATDPKARLNIWFQGQGSIDLDMISLFPGDTWKQRPGGLRADLVQLLADLKPGFLRFPGGCIVEGRELATRYQWKKTVGNVDQRQVIVNRWNTEFRHKPTPDYYQSFGLGFFEYFQLAEDIGAEPLPIINCGMACQFNTSEVVPLEQLDPYLQDALDLIEFANGETNTTWGKLRAALGHPKPFNLKLLGVGNEQWGEQYIERYKFFTKAIKSRYPGIRLVNSVGPDPDGPKFNFLNDTLRALGADILDEHYYRAPDWFLKNAGRYDRYDRKGPKIFAGEYAAQSAGIASPDNKNNWQCALAEAAFMTGLERNADVVYMASYAPLFAHAEGWQWTPDLIWFDNLRSYGTTDYYVQKLFSINKGTHIVPILSGNEAIAGQEGWYASAVLDKNAGELVIKIINASDKTQQPEIDIEGVQHAARAAALTVLQSDKQDDQNSLDAPMHIQPVESNIAVDGNKIAVAVAAWSFNIIRVKIN